ncbi:MAG: RidA family protein [Actinobacteria bacterium]|nr:RidA family protein [Actinomycetota bacterium]
MEKRAVNPWTWHEPLGFAHAIEVAGAHKTLYFAGQTSADDDGTPIHPGDMGAQLNRALDNLQQVLDRAGLTLADLVRLNYYVTDIPAFHRAQPTLSARLEAAGCRPASTLIGVAGLAMPEFLIEIEGTAAV